MRIEPKQAFYNDDTGAVQPWKDIEVTDAVGNKLVAEGLVREIEGGGGGGDKFSAYDYVVKQVDSGTPTFIKGTFSDIYDKLQAMEAVSGLYVRNVTPGQYHDTVCECYPLTYTNYYSSADNIYGSGLYRHSSEWKTLGVEFYSSGDIFVTRES